MSWHLRANLPGGIYQFWVQDQRLRTQALAGNMATAEGRENSKSLGTREDKVTKLKTQGAKIPVEERGREVSLLYSHFFP